MIDRKLKTAVAFLIFNRPETTLRVFEAIRKARPPKLLVVADGPRAKRLGEAEKCEATRAIIHGVDWPCDVLTNYSDENLGCRQRVSSGLNWVFDTVEEAIILEDDCLPHPTFFRFCEELLERYRDDERIMMISGDNFQFARRRTTHSYYYSHFTHIWGWASWKRAWNHYDVDMSLWPEFRKGKWLTKVLGDRMSVEYWTKIFDNVFRGEINTWDYQWTFACWVKNKLSVMPRVNLISNIGFSSNSTHTRTHGPYANLFTAPMEFPLDHPPTIERNVDADNYTQRTMYDPSLMLRIMRKLNFASR